MCWGEVKRGNWGNVQGHKLAERGRKADVATHNAGREERCGKHARKEMQSRPPVDDTRMGVYREETPTRQRVSLCKVQPGHNLDAPIPIAACAVNLGAGLKLKRPGKV
jgi:hypothetical protein